MLGKSVLLHTRDRNGARSITRALRAAGNEVARTDSAVASASLICARAVDLVLVDHHSAVELNQILASADRTIPVIVLAASPDPALLLDIVCDQRARHILAHAGGGEHPLRSIDQREVVITVEKILRRDIFGLGKYLPEFAVDVSACDVQVSSDRDVVVENVQDYLLSMGGGRHLAAAMGSVADELTTNAIYNAPRDSAGRPRYARLSRRHKLTLAANELVRVRFASDGKWFVLSVTDRFGSLRAEHIRSGLRRCLSARDPIRRLPGGAGLGLYTALNSSSQLIFNIDPGVRTEVIAIVDLTRRMRGVHEHGHSLHLFTEVSPASPVPRPVPIAMTSPNVVLSESLRVDLRSKLAVGRGQPVLSLLRPEFSPPQPTTLPPTPPDVVDPIFGMVGLDTLRAILRGAGSRDNALAVTLRFLTTDFAAAIVYEVANDRLVAQMAAGRLADWPRLGALTIARAAPSTLGRLAINAAIRPLRPERYPIDARLTELASGASDDVALAFAVGGGAGRVGHVICAFAPRFGRLSHRPVLAEVRDELESTLTRIERALGRGDLSHWDDPYEEMVVRAARPATDPPYAEFEIGVSH